MRLSVWAGIRVRLKGSAPLLAMGVGMFQLWRVREALREAGARGS